MTSVMIVGNTGVGKSSLGCRLLGYNPFTQGYKPFKVAATCQSVTDEINPQSGTWFNRSGGELKVIDTPGLGDSCGTDKDTQTMAEIGKYLNNHPVNAVLIVQGELSRIDYSLKRLISIIITKLHSSDRNRLAIVLSHYGNSPEAQAHRQQISDYEGDESVQRNRRADEIIKGLEGYAREGLKLSQYDLEDIKNRIFFVDCAYPPGSLADVYAFEELETWIRSNDPINRDMINKETGDVYVELTYANQELTNLQKAAEQQHEKHQQELARVEEQAAKDLAHAKEKQQLAEQVATVKREALEQSMEQQANFDATRLEDDRRRHAAVMKAQAEKYREEEERILAAKVAQQQHLAQMKVLQDEEIRLVREAATRRMQDLEAERARKAAEEERNQAQNHGCFPSNALVEVQTRGRVPISTLQAGERVLSVDSAGHHVYDQVVFFGHKDADSQAQYQMLTLRSDGNSKQHCLSLTPTHFVPTGEQWGCCTFKHARQVTVGEVLWVLQRGCSHTVPAVVQATRLETLSGSFNPFTQGGLIVVDGVVASTHSHWLLDDFVPSRCLPWLPRLYQAAFAPLFVIAKVFGAPALSELLEKHIVPYAHEWPAILGVEKGVVCTPSFMIALSKHWQRCRLYMRQQMTL